MMSSFMRKSLGQFLATLMVIAALAVTSMPARADALDDARAAGLVGERADGYVALVDSNAPANVKNLVKDINDKRRVAYQKIAAEKGVPVEQIGAITAEKIIREILQPGMYYMDATGAWKTK
ncbi:YdbL family protein [Dongia sp.]|uniref:YdbL family protein n=1 Tax=Dongia sp. TaxID=1977262 RepID=UPI0035AE376A